MKLDVVNTEGKGVDPIDADDAVFGIEPNPFVIHQALLAQLANRRTGTAKTKTRGEVAGSTAKIRRQKGTGRARLGAASAPTIRHGGVAFGPRPRSFDQRLPKRMRRLAIRSVLSAKVAEGSLRVLDALAFERPRTKEMASLLQTLGLDRSTLVVTETSDRGVLVSARNLEKIDVLAASYLNVGDMLSHQNLLMTVGAGIGLPEESTVTVRPGLLSSVVVRLDPVAPPGRNSWTVPVTSTASPTATVGADDVKTKIPSEVALSESGMGSCIQKPLLLLAVTMP